MRRCEMLIVKSVVMLLACGTGVQAVTMDLVPVGDESNTPDTRYDATGYGSVDYIYNIGKYEVTSGQYAEFLNAVAKTDAYGLYSTEMWGSEFGCKIQREGEAGQYRYSVAPDRANRPVNFVSYWDACRFVNWMHNGQGGGETETGSYTLNGYTGNDGRIINRNQGATWVITTGDEWYKAAYHKNDGVTGNYYDYPTKTNNVPSHDVLNPDPGNNANFYTPPSDFCIGSPYWMTEVGEFENSESPYGTFDQGGNVWEWSEATVTNPSDLLWGGSFASGEHSMRAIEGPHTSPTDYEYTNIGFRGSASDSM